MEIRLLSKEVRICLITNHTTDIIDKIGVNDFVTEGRSVVINPLKKACWLKA